MSLNDRTGMLRSSIGRKTNSRESSGRARKANLLADLGSFRPDERSGSKKGAQSTIKVPLEDKLKSYLRSRESKADPSPIDRRTVGRNLTDENKQSPVLTKVNTSTDSSPLGKPTGHRKNLTLTDKSGLSKDREGRINSARNSSKGIADPKHKRTNTLGLDLGKLNRNTNNGSSSSRTRQVTQINSDRGQLYPSPLKNRQSSTNLANGLATDRSEREATGLTGLTSKYSAQNRKSPVVARPGTGSMV